MTFSKRRAEMSRTSDSGEGTPFRYQMWQTGAASSTWPMRSRRTLLRVTSTWHRSQTIPLYLIFL